MSDYNEFENNNNNNFQGENGNNNFTYQNVNNFGKPKTMGWSVVSLVTGIVSVVCCCLGITGLFFGAVAIITAIVSRKVLGYFDGLTIAGLILGIFGIVFGLAVVISVASLGEEFWDSYMEEFWKQYDQMYPEV